MTLHLSLLSPGSHRTPRVGNSYAFRQITSPATLQSMLHRRLLERVLVWLVTETRIEPSQRISRILSIFGRKIILVNAHLAPPPFERPGGAPIPRAQDFRFEGTGRLQLLHVVELGKVKRGL